MADYQVVETFVSINGEGRRAGELAVFIRFKGCNLQCSYCDTKWANEKAAAYRDMTETEIYDYIIETGVKNVTLTGGEPLLRDHMDVLLEKLLANKELRVEIETNGSVDLAPFASLSRRPSFTMDYKCGTSGMESKMLLSNYAVLSEEDTVKFVVGSREDLDTAYKVIVEQKLAGRVAVYLSPVFGQVEPEEIVNFLVEKKLNEVRVQLQLHKFIWDPEKKGV